MSEPEKKDQIIFRNREVYERCVEKAKLRKCSPNHLARELVNFSSTALGSSCIFLRMPGSTCFSA